MIDMSDENIIDEFLVLGDKDRSIIIYIYELGELAKPGDIAKRLGLPHSTINSVIKRLVNKKLVNWKEYAHVGLTPLANKMAAHHLKHHIIIHHYFEHELDLSSEDAHKEGLRIAGVISCKTVLQMEAKIPDCDLTPCTVYM
ncbi:MAG: winged helix-turn-helix transcriptional regulator [Candidatus Heimdallarchaeota archaeon]|nr:winged helix-turn-helix transcriptional regulator [Candidatus Heimdallarchaeota archaeon]